MAKAIINGREIIVPSSASTEQIKTAGKIGAGRSLIRRRKTGNFILKPGERVSVSDGDTFVDSPKREKGKGC